MYVDTKEFGTKTMKIDLASVVNEGIVELELSKFFANHKKEYAATE